MKSHRHFEHMSISMQGYHQLVSRIEKRPYSIIAELRRPEGPPSGAPYSYRKKKETHKLIFPWLLWPAAFSCSWARTHVATESRNRDGGHTSNNRLTETCSLHSGQTTGHARDVSTSGPPGHFPVSSHKISEVNLRHSSHPGTKSNHSASTNILLPSFTA